MRQVLALQVTSKEHLGAIQHQARQALEEQLPQLLDEMLTQHVPDDVIINLEHLEVDLGSLNLPTLAAEILTEVQKKLPVAIREEVEIAMEDPQKQRIIPLPAAKVKSIQHYLIHGYMAWWMPANTPNTIEATYLELVDELPEELDKLWWEFKDNPKAIQRFVAQFSSSTIKQTIQVLRRLHSRNIIALAEDLIAIQQGNSLGFPKVTVFTQAVWAATLSQTIAAKTVFSEQTFVQESLGDIAEALDMTYPSLLSGLSEQISRKQQSHDFHSPLPQLLMHLHQTAGLQAEIRQFSPTALIKRFNALLAKTSTQEQSVEELPPLLKEILANVSPFEAQSLILSQLQSEAQIAVLVNSLPTPAIRQLVATLSPAIQSTFRVLTTIWASTIEQEESGPLIGRKPLEQLTLQYISRQTDDREPDTYLKYLFHKLSKQSPAILHQLRTIAQEHQPELLQIHAAKEVNLVIKTLKKLLASASPGMINTNDAQSQPLDSAVSLHDEEPLDSPLVIESQSQPLDSAVSLHDEEPLDSPLVIESQSQPLDSAVSLHDEEPLDSPLVIESQPQPLDSAVYLHGEELLDSPLVIESQSQPLDSAVYLHGEELLEALNLSIRSSIYPATTEVRQLLAPLRKALESIINTSPIDNKQIGKLIDAWQEFLTPFIQDRSAFQAVFSKVQDWVRKIVKEPDHTTRRTLVSRLEDRLETILQEQLLATPPEPLSFATVRYFLLTGKLPADHGSTMTFLTAFVEEVQQGGLQESTITLLQTKSMREKLVDIMPVQHLQALTTALASLPSATFTTYQTVLLKADILKGNTLEAKQRVLHSFFLDAIGQAPASTDIQLMQHVLLAISHYSQMPKQELFRRVRLVAKQHEQATMMIPLLESIDTTIDPSKTEVADALELTLLPVYQSLSEIVPSSILPQYYDVLLPAMKQAIQQGINGAALDEQIARMVEAAFRTLAPDQHATVKALVKSSLQRAALAYQERKVEVWHHFLRTGEVVGEQHTHAHDFLEDFLANPPIKAPQVIDDLQEPQSVKRLVVHLKAPTLARLVMLINAKAHKTVLKDLHSIYTLWSYTSTDQISQQDFRHVWWETALTKLLAYSTETFHEQAWLSQSLLALASAIGVERHALITSLVTVTKTDLVNNKIEKSLRKQLEKIQKVWRREVRKKAKESGLQHPVLRELHKLLEFGLAAWGEHKDSALARLEQQLHLLFAKDGAAIKALLHTYPHQELVARRLAHYFSDAIVDRFIALLAGPFYAFLQQYLTWANALKLDLHAGRPDSFTWRKYNEVAVLAYLLSSTSFDKGALITYHLEQLSKYTGISQSTLLRAMLAQAPNSEVMRLLQALVTPEQLEHKDGKEALLSQEESPPEEVKIYVQNGGLVFLWPFVSQLFEEQGLMEEHKFIDRIAVSNAVHTLQYLATNQLHTPGWRLLLNKLLCGLSYDDVVATGYRPVQDEELPQEAHTATKDSVEKDKKPSDEAIQQEAEQPDALLPEIVNLQQTCEAILKQAMEKWEGLKTLEEFEEYKEGFTLDDFRAYFLNRHSILRRIEGPEESYWHLTVPFADYDSKDVYPPWEFEVIHLPWMLEKLVVFWTPE